MNKAFKDSLVKYLSYEPSYYLELQDGFEAAYQLCYFLELPEGFADELRSRSELKD